MIARFVNNYWEEINKSNHRSGLDWPAMKYFETIGK